MKSGIVDSEEQRRAELFECLAYFTQLREERLNRDEANGLTMMARGKATQDMAPQGFLGNLLLLIVGGNDTTNSMSGGVVAMNRFPEQLKALRSNRRKFRLRYLRLSAGRRR